MLFVLKSPADRNVCHRKGSFYYLSWNMLLTFHRACMLLPTLLLNKYPSFKKRWSGTCNFASLQCSNWQLRGLLSMLFGLETLTDRNVSHRQGSSITTSTGIYSWTFHCVSCRQHYCLVCHLACMERLLLEVQYVELGIPYSYTRLNWQLNGLLLKLFVLESLTTTNVTCHRRGSSTTSIGVPARELRRILGSLFVKLTSVCKLMLC